ncbi:M28 family metallopeptidase [Mobilitalea sibirica]|uniref:M28 family metallopeptidase n=1 Tax=Mobilitalea sibirica TaxID=1462919 RepID=UPI001FB19D9E|nr:M28 family metallopeptidase [Mobilitalea sibirica]
MKKKRIKGIIFIVIFLVLTACVKKDIVHQELFETDATDDLINELDDVKHSNNSYEKQEHDTNSETVFAKNKTANSEIIEQIIQELIKNGSRKWNTESERLAADYIMKLMEGYGYHCIIQEFPAYEYDLKASVKNDYFDLNPYNSEVVGTGHNVIAEKDVGTHKDKVLVISAHYDTVANELGIIDNTSGVVTLLEVARLTANLDLPYTLRFIFFSSEERYLMGSRYYVSSLNSEELSKIVGCINIDMVGYRDGEEIVVATPYFAEDININPSSKKGVNNSLTKEWHKIFPELNTFVKVEGSSDHYPFDKVKIPNMMITQEHFDLETSRKQDSDIENLSIDELENTIHLVMEYLKRIDITNVKYENIPYHPKDSGN